MNSITLRLAASALVIALTTVGCQSDDSRPAALSDKAPKSKRDAFGFQQDAQAALRLGQLQKALELMEEAVALSPRDAGYRMALAELYMRSGRFASAERTFSDTILLNPDNVQASLYLGLSRAVQGKALAATAALDAAEGRAKPGDLGLAYALTGDTGRAIQLLETAARAEGADARTRQNLALAYALAGDWNKARVTAAQDVSPAELVSRMERWATLAAPQSGGVQVAAFFGVTAIEDAGQPLRLALAAPEEATMFASADEPESAGAAVEVAKAVVPAAGVPPQPVAVAQIAPIVLPASQAGDPPPVAMASMPPQPARTASGRYVVQIGAFSSRAQADNAWKAASSRYGFAADRRLVTTIAAPQGTGTFHRLAVTGFSTSGDASGACRAIKAKGGDCFVRPVTGSVTPMRVARR